jgi:hypothetical protein
MNLIVFKKQFGVLGGTLSHHNFVQLGEIVKIATINALSEEETRNVAKVKQKKSFERTVASCSSSCHGRSLLIYANEV